LTSPEEDQPKPGAKGGKPAVGIVDRPSGARLDLPPGTSVVAVNGKPVSSMGEVRDALQEAARVLPAGPMPVTLDVDLPYKAGPARQRVSWLIGETERAELVKLSWESPLSLGAFELEHVLIKASNPGDAIGRGLKRTKMVMLNVYMTFARLFQGTVRVEHLQGPIGIAHAGTILAERGYMWVLFFMALVSVNLAVINFLPMPIVDGGHFLFLVYEQVTGKAVSPAVQNTATLVGLVMIGSLFLMVTYNDLARLLWTG
jgi:regulator of sigma E protease